jgi:D-3-phosphoglycerate dehydrogenase
MPTVAVTTEPLFEREGPHLALLTGGGFDIRYPPQPSVATEAETIEAVRGAEAVVAGGEPYSERVLSQLPDLKTISRMGVGYDCVDVDAATRRGIALTITPNGNHEAVAEHALALLLALTRSIVTNDREVREGKWLKPLQVPLRGKTLGIIGLGRIGRSFAVRAASFRLELLAYDPFVDADDARQLGVELVDFETLLSRSDFVSLHSPLNPETCGLINAHALSLMKRGSYLINTARGGLVNEDDLVAALKSGQLGAAGLDALAEEPPPKDHPLFQLENAVISPHVAAMDPQAIEDMAVEAAQNILDLRQGKWPVKSIVNPAVRERWSWTT